MFDEFSLRELLGICRALERHLNVTDLAERRQNRKLYYQACEAYRERLWKR